MTLAQAIPDYLVYLRDIARRAPATISAYRSDLSHFAGSRSDLPGLELGAITPAHTDVWQATLRHLSDATVRRALNSLSSLFRWAIRSGYVAANPVDHAQRPRKRRRVAPTPGTEEVAAVLAAARGDTERAAILLMATSGLRRAEMLSLDWRAVDMQRRRLVIRGKGDKDRELLVFAEALAALYALHASAGFPTAGPVLRGRKGEALQKSTLQRWFNTWLERSGLREGGKNRYTLHSLRRFAAKHWLHNGLNIRQVQLLLGHEDLQTTILYLNYDMEEIARAAEGISFGLQPVSTIRPVG
jgi:integrase/recombinase XerC